MRRTRDLPTGSGGGGAAINWTKLTIVVIVALPAMVVLLPTTILVFVLALPTAVAFLIDRTRERYLVATVGLLNLCGLMPAVIALWDRGQRFDNAMAVLADMVYWLAAFGAAGVGWAIFISIPPVIAAYYAMATRRRVLQLRRRQKQLVAAWGTEVTGEAPAEEDEAGPMAEAGPAGDAEAAAAG